MSNAIVTASFRNNQLNQDLETSLNGAHIVLLVSAGKKRAYVHEEHHLEATMDLINSCRPGKVTIVVSGKLQRHSFWNSHYYNKWTKYTNDELKSALKQSANLLEAEAIAREPAWWDKNEQMIQRKLKCSKITFMSWQAILNIENYQENYRLINQFYENDPSFREVMTKCVDTYLSHHLKDFKRIEHLEIAKEACTRYILEESPLLLPSTLSCDYTVYHSEPNLVMKEIHKRIGTTEVIPWLSIQYKFNSDENSRNFSGLIGLSDKFFSKREAKKQSIMQGRLVAA